MKLVTDHGGVFRLTNANYVKLLRCIANGGKQEFNFARDATFIGIITADVTCMTAEEAEELLGAE